MSYTPKNLDVFCLAFCGAMSGIAASNRQPISSDPVTYFDLSDIAGAFAEEFDTLWGTVAPNEIEAFLVSQNCNGYWLERSILAPLSAALTPANYTVGCEALIAIIQASNDYFSNQGITPPPFGGSGSVNLKIINVLDFGVTGNGTTDDTLAIQAIFDAIPDYVPGNANSVFIYFPRGFYLISAPLRVAHGGVVISGAGIGLTQFLRGIHFTGPIFIPAPDYTPNWTLQTPGILGSGTSLVFDSNADVEHRPLLCLRDSPFTSVDGLSAVTFEFFFKPAPSAVGTGGSIFRSSGLVRPTVSNGAFVFELADTGGGLYLSSRITTNVTGDVYIGGPFFVPENIAHHIALSYDGANARWFIDGNLVSTVAATGSIVQEFFEDVYLGWASDSFPAGADLTIEPCDGAISSPRISKACLYTTSFIPPTSDLTVTDDTMMLLNFDRTEHQCTVGQTGNLGFNDQDLYFVIRPNPSLIGTEAIENVVMGNFTINCNLIAYPFFMTSAPQCTYHDIDVNAGCTGPNVNINCYESIFRNVNVLVGAVSVSGSPKNGGRYGLSFITSGICTVDNITVTGGSSALALNESSVVGEELIWVPNAPSQIGIYLGSDASCNIQEFSVDAENAETLFQTFILSNGGNLCEFFGGTLETVNGGASFYEVVPTIDPFTGSAIFVGTTFSPAASAHICKFDTPQTAAVDMIGCQVIGAFAAVTPWGDANGSPRVNGNASKRITTGTASVANYFDQNVGIDVATAYAFTLPPNPSPGQPINVKDQSKNASTHNITLLPNVGHTIDGLTDYVINTDGGSVQLSFDGLSDYMVIGTS